MAALVSLEQVIAAAARGALSFDHRFAGWVALQATNRLREMGGGIATTTSIEIDGTGGVRVAPGTPRADDRKSARSVRELLDTLLQHATVSTPALRLCAARPENTDLDGVAKELSFAIGDVERDERRREVAEIATRASAPIVAPVAAAPIVEPDAISARLQVLEERARSANDANAAVSRAIAERDAAVAAAAAARNARADDATRVAELVAERERARFAVEEIAARMQREIDARDIRVNDLERRLIDAERSLVERVSTAASEGARRAGAALAERDSIAAQRDALAGQRDSLASERDRLIAHREALVAERDAVIAEREAKITALEGEITRTRLERAPSSEIAKVYDEKLEALRHDHARALVTIEADRDRRIAAHEARLREAESRLAEAATAHARELERARNDARSDAVRESSMRVGETSDAAERRIDELRAEHARTIANLTEDRDRRVATHEARLREAEARVGETAGIAERRIDDVRAEHTRAVASLIEERDRRLALYETRAKEADSRLTEAAAQHARDLERVRVEAIADAEREAGRRLLEITAAADRRVTELRAEHTRALTSLAEEHDRRTGALEADRDRRLAVLDATLAETEARHQQALLVAQSGKDQTTSELEAAHARAFADASRKHAAALAEAEARHRNALEQVEQKHQRALHESAKALDSARAEAMQAQLQARTDVLRGRDDLSREAEQRHAREVQSALERLTRTMSEDAERARADVQFKHDTELATIRAEQEAVRSSLERQVQDLEQNLFRALADRDAERMLRIDVEGSTAKRLRDVRRRGVTIEEPPPPAKYEPVIAKPVVAKPMTAKIDTPEPPSVAPIATPRDDSPKKKPPVALFVGAGAVLMTGFAYLAGFGPFASAKSEPAPAAAPVPTVTASAKPIVAPITCEAALKIANVPKGSEVLRRLGSTPLAARAPMHVPVELVFTRDGFAPSRMQIDASSPWKHDLVPTLSVSASLDAHVDVDSLTPWPLRKSSPQLPPVIEPSKGTLQLASAPDNAEVWMSEPDEMSDVPCGAGVDLLVVRPLGTVQRVRVEWSAFRGSPPRATHSL